MQAGRRLAARTAGTRPPGLAHPGRPQLRHHAHPRPRM